MVTEQQNLLSQLYLLRDSVEELLIEGDKYEDLLLINEIINDLEYTIINNTALTIGI